MFLLVPAYLGCPRSKAVKRSSSSYNKCRSQESVRVSHACNTVTERRLRFFGHITHSAPDEDHHRALTLLVERQEEHMACKNRVMRCWSGYLSGTRCRLFAYGPPDATAIPKPHHLLPHSNPYSFLPFRYWLTQFVLEKRLLNWCSSSSSSSSSRCKMYTPC